MPGLSGTVSIQTAAATMALLGLKKTFDTVASAGISFDAKMASATIGLEASLNRDSKAAQALLKDLRAFADISPFEMVDVVPLAQRLMGMGIVGKDLKVTLKGIGEQTAALGQGAETFGKISLAMGQMNLKGQVMGQEIRQLAEHGVPAISILARAWGVSNEEMKKLISQGLIPGKEAVIALSEGMASNNFDTMRLQSLQLSGATSTLSDNFKFLVGEALQPTYAAITEVVNRMNVLARDKQVTQWLLGMARDFQAGFGVAVDATKWLGGALKVVWDGLGTGLNWAVGALKKWVGFVWDNYKGAARAAAWFADTQSWLLQKGLGGAGDFFSANLEKGIGALEGQFSQAAGTITGFTGQIAQAWNDTWGAAPDWGAKWEEAGKKVEAAKKVVGTKPKTTDFSGTFIEDSEKAKAKERAAALKLEKDALRDLATAYDAKARAVIAAAQKELDSQRSLQDTLRETFGDLQNQFVALGIINDPMGAEIRAFERLIDLGGQSAKVVSEARRAFGTFNGKAIAARSNLELISGQDGNIPTKSGSIVAAGTAAGGALIQNLVREFNSKSPRSLGASCADVASNVLNTLGEKLKYAANAAQLKRNALAAGWVMVPLGTPGALHVQTGEGFGKVSKAHTTVGIGNGRVAGSSGYKYQEYDITRARGNPVALMPAGAGAPIGAGSKLPTARARFDASGFDLSAVSGNLTTIQAIEKAWGAAVKNTEGNTARFALQSKLATTEFQDALAEAAARTGKSAPQIIAWLRALTNAADFKLAGARAVDAVAASLRELETARRQIGSSKNPLAGILVDFEPGGKFAAATNQVREFKRQSDALKENPYVAAPGAARALDAQAAQLARQKMTLLDAQARLSVAQLGEATKEATRADRERIAILSRAAPVLTALSVGTDSYERAVERAGVVFGVWKDDQIAGLLKTAQSYDKLGGKALQTAKNLAATRVAAPGAAQAAEAEGKGLKGRAAGLRRQANEDADARISAALSAANFERGEARRRASLQTNFDLDNQIKALRGAQGILADLSISEDERERRISRQNFILSKQVELMGQQHSEADALRLATGYADKNDEIARLQKRNETIKSYNALLRESAQNLAVAQGQTAILLANPLSGTLDRDSAIFEKTQALLADIQTTGQTFADFNFFGKLGAFTAEFDAQANLKAARDYVATLKDARGQQLDLQKQLEGAGLGRGKPLSQRKQQDLDWRYDDARFALDNPNTPRTAEQTAQIEAARAQVRGLMDDWEKTQRIQSGAEKIVSGFDTMWGEVISRQKSALDSLGGLLQNALDDWAKQLIESQFKNALFSLFGGALGGIGGGKTPLSVPYNGAAPVSGGGIADGLKAGGRGLKFGGSFAVGIDRVPEDAFVKVHSNEAILSANHAEEYRRQKAARMAGAESLRALNSARALSPATGAASGRGSIVVNNSYTHNGDIKTDSPDDWQRQVQQKTQRQSSGMSRAETLRGLSLAAIQGRRYT